MLIIADTRTCLLLAEIMEIRDCILNGNVDCNAYKHAFWSENLKGRDHTEYLGIDVRTPKVKSCPCA